MEKINWRQIWKKTYRTAIQTFLGLIPATSYFWGWDWKAIASAVVVSAGVCFLSGIIDADNIEYLDDEENIDEPADDEEIEH